MVWRGCTDKVVSWWCVRSWVDIQVVDRSMGNDSRVAAEVYITWGCLVLEDFLCFSLYSCSSTAKQAWLWTRFYTCLDLIFPIRTLNRAPFTISHPSYQHHQCPTPPVTLDRVSYHAPDVAGTVNTVCLLVITLFGIILKSQTVISQCATCVATILRIRMCLHPSNSCKYSNEPFSDFCSVYLEPTHWWVHVLDNWVDELPRHSGFNICQYPHRPPYSNAGMRQTLPLMNKSVCANRNTSITFRWWTLEQFSKYWRIIECWGRRPHIACFCLGTDRRSLPLDYSFHRGSNIQRRLGTSVSNGSG